MPMRMRMRMQMQIQMPVQTFAFPAKALSNLKQLATQAMKGVNSSFKHADQTMRYKHAKQLKQADLTTVLFRYTIHAITRLCSVLIRAGPRARVIPFDN